VRESRPLGSVRGVLSNGHSYRDRATLFCAPAPVDEVPTDLPGPTFPVDWPERLCAR
jgi:hypothetical protein